MSFTDLRAHRIGYAVWAAPGKQDSALGHVESKMGSAGRNPSHTHRMVEGEKSTGAVCGETITPSLSLESQDASFM